MVVQFASEAQLVDGPVRLRVNGEPSSASSSGVIGFAEFAVWLSTPLFVVLAGSFVGRQFAVWRRSTAERREQLKWLMSGGAISVVSCVAIVLFGTGGSVVDRIAADLAVMGIAALPVGIGIGILKYRLYEIDRLVSRTISYALLTATLVGIFVGIVVIMTDLLPLSSPVAVAASTLTAAALYNPHRLKSQRLIDRRFNRARYDAQETVAAFNARLRDALDLDSVRGELIDAVDQAIAPAHASLWIRPSSSASPHSR
jgi:hypothetical protein